MDVRFLVKHVESSKAVAMNHSSTISPDRNRLNFSYAVEQRFAFLSGFGFALDESLPTIVRHRKGDL